jgi:hypothetical protein
MFLFLRYSLVPEKIMSQRIRGVLAPVVTPLKLVRSPLARSYPRHFTFYVADPISSIQGHLSHGVQRAGVGVIAKCDLRTSVCEKPNARTNPGRLGPRCHPI